MGMTAGPSEEPIGATILTGFLGSGKTTLLNHILHAPHQMRIAVIVNEFGAVGVDGSVVEGEAQFVELDNGCLCCALNEDLDKTLRDLAQRGGFSHVLVETTGMADPLPVAWTFNRPGLSQAFRVDAIVTVVDAANVAKTMAEVDEARQQVERADVFVLNKLDLVADGGIAAEALLREHNTVAPIVRNDPGSVLWQLLLAQVPSVERPTEEAALGHHHHHASLDAYAFACEAVLDDAALEDFLFAVPDSVYRIKGLVRTNAEWEWTLVNGVAGRLDIRPWEPTRQVQQAGLVFIGRDLDQAALRMGCEALVLKASESK